MKTVVLIVLLAACKDRPPSTWIGLDRASVSCTFGDLHWSTRTANCIGAGHEYHCVTEDDDLHWRCAEVLYLPTERAP